ncbi:DNA cytosine methyltransferase [Azospirillum sp. Marseille-Q6669]
MLTEYREVRHFHVCGGIGGGVKGFNRGTARVGNMEAVFRCIGSVDVDPVATASLEKVTGIKGTVLDLFDRRQYVAFHGKGPPADWRPATAEDFRRAAGNERPHIVFMSTPCKGNSGLISTKTAQAPKYIALNELALRAVFLTLEAWSDDPPELILFENVPRIAQRSRGLLDKIIKMLHRYGYAVAETVHDCGEIGGLAQSRKRFLMVARHMAKVPPFLYEPPKRRLRGVGEVLERLPLPGDPLAGPMHRVPSLHWKTWVRLAFVEAGSDWRSLNRLRVEDGVLTDYGIVPAGRWRDDILGVLPWEGTAPTITGNAGTTTGRFSVADPRATSTREGTGYLGVQDWAHPSGTVTGNARPGAGAFSVADPRHPEGADQYGQYGVRTWDQPTGAIINVKSPGQGPHSVADPRYNERGRFNNVYRVVRFGEPCATITAGQGPTSGGMAVADPRAPVGSHTSKYRVTGFDEYAGTVIAASTTGQGAFSVADPRCQWNPNAHTSKLRVIPYGDPSSTITGSASSSHGFTSGALSVADPRCSTDRRNGALGVRTWDEAAGAVAGESLPPNGAFSVADPRPDCFRDGKEAYTTGGHYGVLGWDETSGAVTGHPKNNNGRWSVADPREVAGEPVSGLPAPDQKMVAVIQATDGTWHRPFTTLELAALQSLVDLDNPCLTLAGSSDAAWREHIGNMVPPDAAAAMASVMGRTLLLAWSGESFMLSSDPIWVQPLTIALAVDTSSQIVAE